MILKRKKKQEKKSKSKKEFKKEIIKMRKQKMNLKKLIQEYGKKSLKY